MGHSVFYFDRSPRLDGRESLPLLAALQSGNVADLIELEGIPFSGFGSERIARLSKASLRRMKLPLGCRFRVWAVQKAMAYWKVIFGVIIVLGGGIWRDLARRRRYRQHVEVCSMRNDSYKALLDHAARESTPMQVGHIQDFVADRWRSGGEGRTASAKKLVLRLWPYVEREVEQDSRIRRSYKNVRGQQNVPCWEWLAPSTSFDTIGALDPGSPPLMWLLPNKKR